MVARWSDGAVPTLFEWIESLPCGCWFHLVSKCNERNKVVVVARVSTIDSQSATAHNGRALVDRSGYEKLIGWGDDYHHNISKRLAVGSFKW